MTEAHVNNQTDGGGFLRPKNIPFIIAPSCLLAWRKHKTPDFANGSENQTNGHVLQTSKLPDPRTIRRYYPRKQLARQVKSS
ncbi:hypothetical protein OAE79_01740 [Rhodopirellula sp.]|nr:hypothetical protein [Rhodopirellula sp.]MDB4679037.1 hypothetical protein [Rhodopirellula sp.]